ARFVREGNILGRFTHPHIAHLRDAGVSPSGQPYLVLEHVEGEPIDRYCDRRMLDIEGRVRLFLDVLAAVAHAHSHLIVHRDIKPSNVLVRDDGEVKLLDFGIAKLLEDDQAPALTRAAGPLTPQFAAPEQLTNGDITTATDVYSLGVLLYVLLTGVHPAGPEQQSAAELVQAITSLEPRQMSEVVDTDAQPDRAATRAASADRLRRTLRGDLDTIVAKALKKNPHERYRSVAAFAGDLRAFLAHEPISARPDTLAYRATKFVRRHRLQVALAAVALVAVVAGITGTLIQARRARSERDFAFRQLARADAINGLQSYVLSDAAPSGKPFTVDALLSRAEHIVQRQHGDLGTRVELLISIGGQYTVADEYDKSRQLLQEAYRLSKNVADPAVRANAACKLAQVTSRSGDFTRAEALFHEGISALPDDPLYQLPRVSCWTRAAEIAINADRANDAVARAQTALQLLSKSPIRSDLDDLDSTIVLASAYNFAGKRAEAIRTYEAASQRLQALGRDDTQMAATVFNNWGVTLLRAGQPLPAEAALRHSIAISRDGSGEDVTTSTTLGNYALTLYLLGRYDEAAPYAERAYDKAVAAGDNMATDFALLHRARIYRGQDALSRSRAMLAEVAARMARKYKPGSLPFGVLAFEQAQTAQAAGDLQDAGQSINHALDIVDVLARTGHAPPDYQSRMLTVRAAIELQLGRPGNAVDDASRAARLAEQVAIPGSSSVFVGQADLVLGRALQAQGDSQQAQAAFRSAVANLEPTLGKTNAEVVEAQKLAGIQQ
ncbi:MAG: protein kinase domain-containing protein, partial [Terriglobales bacterium]